MTEQRRRFPAPWSVDTIEGGFRIVDANGVAVAYVYARDDMAAKTGGSEWLTTTEAHRIARVIARLPDVWPPPRSAP